MTTEQTVKTFELYIIHPINLIFIAKRVYVDIFRHDKIDW